jgi:hypothetical protein
VTTSGAVGVPTKPPGEPCVLHLVRAANGLEPFTAFLESYHAHPAGVAHELAIVFKGFRTPSDADAYLRIAGEKVSEAVFVDDEGFDLSAYFAATARLQRPRYCFLNSFTEIRADGWLALMNRALDDPTVGLVGATGSWASIRSYLRFHLGLGGAYAGIFDGRAQTRATMDRLVSRRGTVASPPPSWLAGKLATAAEMRNQALWFDSFPSHHVRTNAFMLSDEVCTQMHVRRLRTKVDAYRLESGRGSITRHVERLGLRPVIVTCDGVIHDVAAWAASGVFWQRDQGRLLVADNQTRDYTHGDAEIRLLLSRYAWGELADPS